MKRRTTKHHRDRPWLYCCLFLSTMESSRSCLFPAQIVYYRSDYDAIIPAAMMVMVAIIAIVAMEVMVRTTMRWSYVRDDGSGGGLVEIHACIFIKIHITVVQLRWWRKIRSCRRPSPAEFQKVSPIKRESDPGWWGGNNPIQRATKVATKQGGKNWGWQQY